MLEFRLVTLRPTEIVLQGASSPGWKGTPGRQDPRTGAQGSCPVSWAWLPSGTSGDLGRRAVSSPTEDTGVTSW